MRNPESELEVWIAVSCAECGAAWTAYLPGKIGDHATTLEQLRCDQCGDICVNKHGGYVRLHGIRVTAVQVMMRTKMLESRLAEIEAENLPQSIDVFDLRKLLSESRPLPWSDTGHGSIVAKNGTPLWYYDGAEENLGEEDFEEHGHLNTENELASKAVNALPELLDMYCAFHEFYEKWKAGTLDPPPKDLSQPGD